MLDKLRSGIRATFHASCAFSFLLVVPTSLAQSSDPTQRATIETIEATLEYQLDIVGGNPAHASGTVGPVAIAVNEWYDPTTLWIPSEDGLEAYRTVHESSGGSYETQIGIVSVYAEIDARYDLATGGTDFFDVDVSTHFYLKDGASASSRVTLVVEFELKPDAEWPPVVDNTPNSSLYLIRQGPYGSGDPGQSNVTVRCNGRPVEPIPPSPASDKPVLGFYPVVLDPQDTGRVQIRMEMSASKTVPPGTGIYDYVGTMGHYDDSFAFLGGMAQPHLLRWDGGNWVPLKLVWIDDIGIQRTPLEGSDVWAGGPVDTRRPTVVLVHGWNSASPPYGSLNDDRRECVGGPNAGSSCTNDADCEHDSGGVTFAGCQRLCGGYPQQPCETSLDCQALGTACEQPCYCNFVSAGDNCDGPPFGALEIWRCLARKLPEKNVNVLAWDWQFEARSANDELPVAKLDLQGKLLAYALGEAFAGTDYAGPVQLIGHSLGGGVAAYGGIYQATDAETYRHRSELVRQVTLFDVPENRLARPWATLGLDSVLVGLMDQGIRVDNYWTCAGCAYRNAQQNVFLGCTLSRSHGYPRDWYLETIKDASRSKAYGLDACGLFDRPLDVHPGWAWSVASGISYPSEPEGVWWGAMDPYHLCLQSSPTYCDNCPNTRDPDQADSEVGNACDIVDDGVDTPDMDDDQSAAPNDDDEEPSDAVEGGTDLDAEGHPGDDSQSRPAGNATPSRTCGVGMLSVIPVTLVALLCVRVSAVGNRRLRVASRRPRFPRDSWVRLTWRPLAHPSERQNPPLHQRIAPPPRDLMCGAIRDSHLLS